MRRLLLLLPLLLLAACTGGEQEASGPPPPSTPAKGDVLFRGHLIAADDPSGWFRPCGLTNRVSAVDGTDGGLWTLVENTAGGVEVPLYAELRGHFQEGAPQPRLVVDAVAWLAMEGGDCTATDPYTQLIAVGTEPFWRLTVGSRGELRWQTPEENLGLDGAGLRLGGFLDGTDATTRHEVTTPDGRRFSISLSHETCRGGMVASWYPFSATVTLDGETVQGCARPGLLPVAGSGQYHAELPAASSPGRLVRLTLTDHGAATLSTDYRNDAPAILQQGLWHADPEDVSRIVVQLLEKGGAPHAELLHFDREGYALRLVDYDEAVYGSEGMYLEKEAP